MNFYWVNLGDSYKEVKEYSYLWAPAYTDTAEGKKTVKAGWKHVPAVSKGDILICYANGKIIYIAIAKKDAYSAQRPSNITFDKWKLQGFKIEVDLEVLPIPIDMNEVRDEIYALYNDKCSPKLLDKNKKMAQQYLIALPQAAGIFLLDTLGEAAIKIQEKLPKSNNQPIPNATTKESIIKARIGQGKFREDVLKLWNNRCPVTNVDLPELLIASHILSWQLSDDVEKLDKYNGLPLSPSIDKLFDKGFISFADHGDMLIGKNITTEILQKLGINLDTKITGLKNEHFKYLKRHREIYGFRS